jgi:hypothetical protein
MLWAARVLARAFGSVWEFVSRLGRRRPEIDPAEELRNKLAETRARAPEPAPAAAEPAPGPPIEPAPEPTVETGEKESEPVSTDLENLRRDVHARARALSEEMRGTNESD